jgi:hypothetical protein
MQLGKNKKSCSLTFKIPIDLLIWKTVHFLFSVCQFRFTGGGGPFTMSFPAKTCNHCILNSKDC